MKAGLPGVDDPEGAGRLPWYLVPFVSFITPVIVTLVFRPEAQPWAYEPVLLAWSPPTRLEEIVVGLSMAAALCGWAVSARLGAAHPLTWLPCALMVCVAAATAAPSLQSRVLVLPDRIIIRHGWPRSEVIARSDDVEAVEITCRPLPAGRRGRRRLGPKVTLEYDVHLRDGTRLLLSRGRTGASGYALSRWLMIVDRIDRSRVLAGAPRVVSRRDDGRCPERLIAEIQPAAARVAERLLTRPERAW